MSSQYQAEAVKNAHKNSRLLLAILSGLMLGGVTVLFVFGAGPASEYLIRETLIATGRISFLLFLVPMVAAPLHTLFNNDVSQWLVQRRNLFGMALIGNQLCHLGFVIFLYQISESQPEPTIILIGGIIGFIYLFAMGIFSFPEAVAWLGQDKARKLHQLAFYYIVGIFTYDLVFRNLDDPSVFFWSLLFSAYIVRILAWVKDFNAPKIGVVPPSSR